MSTEITPKNNPDPFSSNNNCYISKVKEKESAFKAMLPKFVEDPRKFCNTCGIPIPSGRYCNECN